MRLRTQHWFVLLALAAVLPALAARQKACVTADEASKMLNKNICISAHVYDVVQLPDGTSFLDVCTPQTPDEACRFTIISLPEDRGEVGELRKYRDMNVQVRGIVLSMHGRAGMLLSHSRQFNGGPPKFKPQPQAHPRVQRGPEPASHQRPQPALTGRAAGLHEYAGSGDSDG